MKARLAAAALLATLVLLGNAGEGIAQRAAGTGAPDSVRVTGEVLDRATGRGIPSAAVTLYPVFDESEIAWQGSTDDLGRFRTGVLTMGTYEFRAEVIGFESVRKTVPLLGAAGVHLRAQMVPEALLMDPIVVTSLRPSRLESSGFFDRRRMGLGHTFTREDIEELNPLRPSDIFRAVPGVQVVPSRDGYGSTLRYRGGCQPQVVIDGMTVEGPFAFDELLTVQDIEAVEVYSSGTAPARFSRGQSGCGTILAWTRGGGDTDGEPMTWQRLARAAAIVGLAYLASQR
ncbi:MAG: TonB-dependent receptor plug domain-containing protein [Gemmatimonadota bacterium]